MTCLSCYIGTHNLHLYTIKKNSKLISLLSRVLNEKITILWIIKLQLGNQNHSYTRYNFVKFKSIVENRQKILRSVVDYLWGYNIKIKIPQSVTINKVFLFDWRMLFPVN